MTRNTYDPLGRLEMTVVTSGDVSDTTMRSYNVRGWQTGIQNDNWSAQMRYNNPVFDESHASYTGNISEWEWSRGNTTDTYSLKYDALSRIVDSRLFRNSMPTEALSENGISYDSNGNILTLKRTGEDGSSVNNLTYHYDRNRFTCLSDGDFQSQNYTYDADGNMTFDGRTGMALFWNELGLVEKVCKNDTVLVNYSYLADGTKVSALNRDGDGLLYLGSLIYKKTGSSISLESARFAGGRFVAREAADGGKAMVPMFHVTDHLGSVRAVVDGVSGEVVETNDYYPFGSRWNTATNLTDQTNRFRYNSKEEQSSLYPTAVRNAISYIDYGARQYDPVLGRWFAQDPLSEKYYGISPYAFCAGNPVKYLDPDGEIIGTAIDVASVAIGIGSFIKNVRSGNVKEAVGDAVGVAVDVVAAAMPFIPGGVGLVRNGAKTAKAINAIDNAADAVKGAEKVIDAGTDAAKAGKYSEVPNPRNAGTGKKFTQKQKAEILQANMNANGGVLRSDGDGRVLNMPKRNIKGQKADMNQAEVDHVKARSKGGSNKSNNAQVLSKEENLKNIIDNMEKSSLGVFTTKKVFSKTLELDLIIYDEEGDWQFLNSTEDLETANALIVSIDEILSLSATLLDVIYNMSIGTVAMKLQGEWKIYKTT